MCEISCDVKGKFKLFGTVDCHLKLINTASRAL